MIVVRNRFISKFFLEGLLILLQQDQYHANPQLESLLSRNHVSKGGTLIIIIYYYYKAFI